MTAAPTIRHILALAAILTGTHVVRAGPVTLSVPSLEAKPGQEVDVPIAVKGAKGMSALQILLTYDPAVLEVVKDVADPDKSFIRGKVLPENAILHVYVTTIPPPDPKGEPTPVTSGRLPILFLGGADPSKKELHAVQEDGILVTIRFRVIGRTGQKTTLGLEKAEAFQLNDMDMLVKTEAGELTVTSDLLKWWWVLLIPLALLLLFLVWRMLRRQPPQTSRPRLREEELVAVPMDAPVRHPCVRCGRPITIPLELAGKTFKCPACGTAQTAGG